MHSRGPWPGQLQMAGETFGTWEKTHANATNMSGIQESSESWLPFDGSILDSMTLILDHQVLLNQKFNSSHLGRKHISPIPRDFFGCQAWLRLGHQGLSSLTAVGWMLYMASYDATGCFPHLCIEPTHLVINDQGLNCTAFGGLNLVNPWVSRSLCSPHPRVRPAI